MAPIWNLHRVATGLLFAQLAPPRTTFVYTHPSDEELYEGIRDLRC